MHNYNFKGYYAIVGMTFGKWNVVVVCSSYVTPTCEVTKMRHIPQRLVLKQTIHEVVFPSKHSAQYAC